MADDTLAELLSRNRNHVESLSEDHFAGLEAGQEPEVVSVCCSDSRVSQEGMWDVTDPGWLFTPSVIGNQTWDLVDGERVVEGSVDYPLVNTGTGTAAVVGHTQCGAVTAAYQQVQGEGGDHTPGIQKWLDLLVPVVEDGLAGPVDETAPTERVIDELVEYNVRRQVAFLDAADEVPDAVDVYGFVYDFTGRYDETRGRTYLVAANETIDPDALEAMVPSGEGEVVRTLLE